MASHAYPTSVGGNAGEFVHGLASALVDLGHEVYAVIPWDPALENSRLMDGVHLEPYYARDSISYGKASNAYVRTPRLAVGLSLFRGFLKLRQVIKERKIDIIHAHWAIPMGFVGGLSKAATDTPLVITMHGRDVYVNPEAGFIVPTLWYIKPFLWYAFRQADRLIAISRDCFRHAQRAGAPVNKLEVLYNGANVKRFFPTKSGTTEVRHKFSISPKAKLLLSVRSLTYRKGLDVLIRAMPRIIEAEPLTVALVVGDGPEYERLIDLRDELGLSDKFLFAGRVANAELPPFENACDLFVIPSREEGFGVAAAEAMACGKPIVGTKAGGLVEIIEHNQTGLLVEPDNAEQLAEAIIRVLQEKSLATRLGENGRRTIETDFNWINVAHQTVELYENVLCTS